MDFILTTLFINIRQLAGVAAVLIFLFFAWYNLRNLENKLLIFDLSLLTLIVSTIFSWLLINSENTILTVVPLLGNWVTIAFSLVLVVVFYRNYSKNVTASNYYLITDRFLLALLPVFLLTALVNVQSQVDLGYIFVRPLNLIAGLELTNFPINFIRIFLIFVLALVSFSTIKNKGKSGLFTGVCLLLIGLSELILRYLLLDYQSVILGSFDLIQLLAITLIVVGLYVLISFFSSYETEEQIIINIRSSLGIDKAFDKTRRQRKPESFRVSYQRRRGQQAQVETTWSERWQRFINKFLKQRKR